MAPNTPGSRFLSTLPARGATRPVLVLIVGFVHFYPRSPRGERHTRTSLVHCDCNFYPRSPRGERLLKVSRSTIGMYISIHAPREGSDRPGLVKVEVCDISIHAPREGSDPVSPAAAGSRLDFYPRSPRGERQQERFVQEYLVDLFLSTLPARGATAMT